MDSHPERQDAELSPETTLSKVTVIIPALNEEKSLPLVLEALPPVGQVIVVDNGSTDRTAFVAKQYPVTVVCEGQRGYGAACLRGIKEIGLAIQRGHKAPEIVVFLDGDYSDHPEQLPELVAPIAAGQAEFVLGSRLLGEREPGAMPPQSVYGNKLACFLMRWLFRGHYTDLGPFRAIDYLKLIELNMTDQNFGWTIEMQIKAAWAGLRTQEVPVAYRKRVGTSKISGTIRGTIKAGSKILYTIAKYWFSKPSASSASTTHADSQKKAAA